MIQAFKLYFLWTYIEAFIILGGLYRGVMSQTKELVESGTSLDENRLDAEDQTLYVQTGEEYDQILSRAQMAAVDGKEIRTSIRLCGPSGCGKTTLASSLAVDVKVADELINEHGLPIWKMTMDELVLLHDIAQKLVEEDGILCPICEESGCVYKRKTKNPPYRCGRQSCKHAFTEEEAFEPDENKSLPNGALERLKEVSSVKDELTERGYLFQSGKKRDEYPHSRAEVYRSLYEVYCGERFPSTPYFEVTMSHAKYAKDLIGHPHVDEDGTTFIKGKITKAVQASNDEVTVLNLDEINRAPTSAKDELYDALDGRVKISMDEVGGIEIEGTPENLIIVSTMNKGSGHHVEPLDFAEKRRLRSTYYVDFLGKEYPQKERELIIENTNAPEDLADLMVEVANKVRSTAENRDTDLSYGLPTGVLLEWAEEAYTNSISGIEDPVMKAGKSAVANAIYDHSENEIMEVESMISTKVSGQDFFETGFLTENLETEEESEEGEETSVSSNMSGIRFVCTDPTDSGCSYAKNEENADSSVIDELRCPECGGHVDKRVNGHSV